MTRINELFSRKNKGVINIYFTAGFPLLESTVPIMKVLQQEGADMVELGMPYSDPLADGPVIQASSSKAITNGMTIEKLFDQLKDFRKEIHLPVVLMGYMNPVLQYGFERFCRDAASVGVDGLILPDLPLHEFETVYGPIIRRHGLDSIFLVTPQTPIERIRRIDQLSSGFVYAVSSSSTTGTEVDVAAQSAYFRKLRDMDLSNPVLVGFGIKDRQSFEAACEYTNGAIIGSAIIKALENNNSPENSVKQFMNGLIHRRAATNP